MGSRVVRPEVFGEKLTSAERSSISPSTRTPTTATHTPQSEPKRYREFDLNEMDYVYAVSENALVRVSSMHCGDTAVYAKVTIDAQTRLKSHYADRNEYVAVIFGIGNDDSHLV